MSLGPAPFMPPSCAPSSSASASARASRAAQSACAAQQVAPAGGGDVRRLGRPHEVGQQPHEAQRIVEVREVAGSGKDLELAARHQAVGVVRMRDRDDRVALAPHDQERQRLGEVEPVARVHALAAEIDDPPERVQERRARRAVRERGVAAQDLADVGVDAQPDAAEQAPHRPAGTDELIVDEQREHELGAREAGRPQQRRDLAAEPAAAHEHEALAVLGELVGELHRHAAAERVPDERRPLVPERDQQIADAARVGAQRVVAARLGRLAVAEQIGSDDREVLREVREHVGPGGRRRRDPVHHHDHRAAPRRAVEDVVAVQDDLVEGVALVHLALQPVLAMCLDEAPVGQRGADRQLAGDERRAHDLRELARGAVADALEQRQALPLRRQRGPAAHGGDHEVREARRDVEVVVAHELEVEESDARVDDLRDVLSAGDEDRRQAVREMRVRAQRSRLDAAEPAGGAELDQLAR